MSEREKLVYALFRQIDKDLMAMLDELNKVKANSEDFINLSKRMDQVTQLRAQLQKYILSMKGFDWIMDQKKD